MSRVQPHTRVALFLSEMKVTLQRAQTLEVTCHIGALSHDLLHAHTIDAIGASPFDKAFVGRRADAVDVDGNQPKRHKKAPP